MIVNISTSAQVSEQDVRNASPATCFPASLDGVDLTDFGFAHVQPTDTPAYDVITQQVVSGVTRVGESWVQVWEVRTLTAEQITANRMAAVSVLESEMDRYLDNVAQQHRFTDRTRLALRAAYPNKWHDLAVAYGTWMDNVNALCESAITDVLTGARTLPTWEQLLAELPAFEVPA